MILDTISMRRDMHRNATGQMPNAIYLGRAEMALMQQALLSIYNEPMPIRGGQFVYLGLVIIPVDLQHYFQFGVNV